MPRTASWLPDRAFRADAVTLAAFLAVHLERTVILAGRGDAANALTPDAVALLTADTLQATPDCTYGDLVASCTAT